MTTSQLPSNRILAQLDAGDLALLQPHLEPVDLPLRRKLATAHQPIEHVYFPDKGIASVVHSIRRDPPIEIGLIGREGLVNVAVVLGSDRAATDTMVQLSGSGWRIDADELRAAVAQSPTLHEVFLRYAHAFMIQIASTVLANGKAKLEERLARWLLMVLDRQDDPDIKLTHEFLSFMLGVRRSGVSIALSEFDRRGLVGLARGRITVFDRDGLVEAADGYYGMAEAQLAQYFPTDDKT